ncbi:hypothetical protein [Streptomyces sp. NPDC098781]|uniref:hypothetical protein n=1 Tax=Streptomyces sp. NPDC098781 TaxID=3366097 RepID=UPI003817FB9C
MAVSLGMRISGLLVVGAVAVAAAAFTGDGGGTADGRGDGGTIVTAGPTDGAGRLPTDPAGISSAPPAQRPDGHIGAPAVTGTPGSPYVGGKASGPPRPSPSPTVSPKLVAVPDWLPPGPDSPDADGTLDPAGVYDLLRDPARCRAALGAIPRLTTDGDWVLLRGLATACLAVQGEGGRWEQAVRDHAALAGGDGSCKGRAAHAVLGALLDFHRRHPGAIVRLKPSSSETPACQYRISGVDTGGDGTAKPGEVIGIELAGAYFDTSELLVGGSVSVGALPVPGVPVLKPGAGGRVVLSVVVPPLEPGPVDVAVRYGGTEVRLSGAFTVGLPDVVLEPSGPGETGYGAAASEGARHPGGGPVTAATGGAPARPTPG